MSNQAQLSLFDDVIVHVPAPTAQGTSPKPDSLAEAEGHALTFGSVPTKPAKKTAQAAGNTVSAKPQLETKPQERVTRTVEPDIKAKLRVTLEVYRQLRAVADQVIPQLQAMLPGESENQVLAPADAFAIAKTALESTTLHAAIHLMVCVVVPPVVTETRVPVAFTQPVPSPSPVQRSTKSSGRGNSPVPPGKHLPMVPFVLAVANQQHPYQLPAIKKFECLYITPERIRIRNQQGQETNRTHQELWCMPSNATFEQAQSLYETYQLALDALAARYRAYGNYKNQLAAAGGAVMHPQPLCEIVVRLENPDKQHGYATRWSVPSLVRFTVKKHTDTTLEGKTHGLGDSGLYVVCRSEEEAQALESDHRIVVEAQQAWLTFLKECGTVREAATDDRYGKIGGAVATMFDEAGDDDEVEQNGDESDTEEPDAEFADDEAENIQDQHDNEG